jgi:hypothetical protein
MNHFKEKLVSLRELGNTIPTTTYGTFALYRYPAKFIPQVISYALKTYAKKHSSIFDPFAGYGTVGTVSKIFGNDYELWDLNPLMKYFHTVSVMKPKELDLSKLNKGLISSKKTFVPEWGNIAYWFHQDFIPLLSKAWGYYHSMEDTYQKNLLFIPLVKTTRYFSYNDQQRQKLSRSPLAEKRIKKLLEKNWREEFYRRLFNEIEETQKKIYDYWKLDPKPTKSYLAAGIDTISKSLSRDHNILITSPPYLQAQEYIRSVKIDLFWAGFSEADIRRLGKLEIPYRDVPKIEISSELYEKHLKEIDEPKIRMVYERYFHGILGSISRLQENITERLLLFVGSATLRGESIPIDRIFIEHLKTLGWKHEITLIDTIVSRQMFFYSKNPATGIKDNRMLKEHLVVLSRTK